jgi:SprT protein
MDLSAAEQLARRLMQRHGLLPQWQFSFDRAVRRFGSCNCQHKKITLSAHLTLLNDKLQVKDTILHEIAHALAPRGECHGKRWKSIARSIGCSAERCYTDDVVVPKRKYTGTCPTCAVTITRNRRKRLSCGRCDRKFNPAHIFVWSISQT